MSKVEEAVKQAMGWNDKQLRIYQKMGSIVVTMNDMAIEDLKQMRQEIDRATAFEPLIDPTAWRGGKFEEAAMIKKVVQAIIAFKQAVSGIGRFTKVTEGKEESCKQ